MFLISFLSFIQAEAPRLPVYFNAVVLILLIGGGLGWITAAVIGFSRARAYGAAARWFGLAAVCLCIYHLQWLVSAMALVQNDFALALSLLAFFNLFIALAAVCVIVGLLRLTDLPR